jgi:hypothetical protein
LFQDSLPLKILNDLPCCKFRGNPLTVWALGGKVDPEQRAANPSAQVLPDDSEECAPVIEEVLELRVRPPIRQRANSARLG